MTTSQEGIINTQVDIQEPNDSEIELGIPYSRLLRERKRVFKQWDDVKKKFRSKKDYNLESESFSVRQAALKEVMNESE